jgi:hypothetical protein
MARGTWDDFTTKYGFGDGAQTEGRDYRARDTIIETLNDLPAFKQGNIRAVGYDRPGMHNSCLILLLDAGNGSLTDEELIKHYLTNENVDEVDLPEGDYELEEIIAEAYAVADEQLNHEPHL